MPDAPGLELIAQELNGAAEGSVLGTYHEHGQGCLIVNPERILDVLGWLRDTPGQEYRFLSSLHGVDYLPGRAALRRRATSCSTCRGSSACGSAPPLRSREATAPGDRLAA